MSEWRELKTLQDVAEAQKNGEAVQTRYPDDDKWQEWAEVDWHGSRDYRSRPEKKVKTVVLREALMRTYEEFSVVWCSEEYVKGHPAFVRWLDTPERIVEVDCE
jgi:hypothetical protein